MTSEEQIEWPRREEDSLVPPFLAESDADSATSNSFIKPIKELDRVRLLATVKSDEGVLPSGTMGTAVYRYAGGEAYDVEFTAPLHALLTLRASEIAPARG